MSKNKNSAVTYYDAGTHEEFDESDFNFEALSNLAINGERIDSLTRNALLEDSDGYN